MNFAFTSSQFDRVPSPLVDMTAPANWTFGQRWGGHSIQFGPRSKTTVAEYGSARSRQHKTEDIAPRLPSYLGGR